MIITKSISRFARNTLDCLKYIRKLRDKNIPVFFEKENINSMDSKGEVLLTIMASLAQQESQSLSKNVKLGIQFRYQSGKVQVNHHRFMLEILKENLASVVNSETEQELADITAELATQQQELLKATREKKPYDDIADAIDDMDACRDALIENGIWLCQYPVPVEQPNSLGLVTKLTHAPLGQAGHRWATTRYRR